MHDSGEIVTYAYFTFTRVINTKIHDLHTALWVTVTITKVVVQRVSRACA